VPDALVRDGVTYRIMTDNAGSVRWVLNAKTGEVMQRLDHDAFGRVLPACRVRSHILRRSDSTLGDEPAKKEKLR
jgi:hypothetical protein